MRNKIVVVALTIILLLPLMVAYAAEHFDGAYGSGPEKFTLATGSPGELGLLKALGEAFSRENHGQTTLLWIKAGRGSH